MWAPMIYETLTYRVEKSIARIELNRPARRNAYTQDMGEELVHALRSAIQDDAVRVVLLTGAGRSFCAGADRDYLTGKSGKNGLRLGEEAFINIFSIELSRSAKPLIAAINGAAIGVGATMLLPFDIRIAASDASFGFSFTRLGMVPGMGATHTLQRLVGYAKTAELLFCDSLISAQEALEIGLISKVVPPDQLLSAAYEIALRIVASPQAAIAATRRSLAFAVQASLGAAIANELSEARALQESREVRAQSYMSSPDSLKKAWRDIH